MRPKALNGPVGGNAEEREPASVPGPDRRVVAVDARIEIPKGLRARLEHPDEAVVASPADEREP
jgi:hypothetical protein